MQPLQLNRFYLWKIFFLIFLPVMGFMAILLGLFDRHHLHETETRLIQRIEQHHHLQQQQIERHIGQLLSDFYYLSQDLDLFNHLVKGSPPDKDQVKRLMSFIMSRENVDQYRFVLLDGREAFRINQPQVGLPVLVPPEKLQNKSRRYYFVNAKDLDPMHYYISPLDLNIEHGELEYPFKPMLRVAMPVYSHQKIGVLIVNYLGAKLLEDIRRTTYLDGGQLMITNEQGYYLLHPNEEMEWGFMMPQRKDSSFGQQFPRSWAEIQARNNGYFHNHEGLFVFDKIDLTRLIISNLPMRPSNQNLPKWTVISQISQAAILSEHYQQMLGIYYSYAALTSLLAVFCFYFAWHQQKLKASQLLNKEQTVTLKKRINELNCLYDVTHLTESEESSFEEMMQRLVNQIPQAWEYPEYCSARLVIGADIWRTPNYKEPEMSQKEEIFNDGVRLGFLEVGYSLNTGRKRFLDEELSLLQALALRVRKVYQYQSAREMIQSHQEQLERQVSQRTSELAEANSRLIHEVAEKQRLTEVLAEAKQHAEEATEMKTTFLSLVAHDLKSPFFSILGILRRILRKEANLDPKHRNLLESSILSGQRLLDMIDKLININKIQTGGIQPDYQEILPHDMVGEILDQFADAADQKGISLVNDLAPKMVVETDPFLLGEVLSNLISNAIKFCSTGDQIRVYREGTKGLKLVVADTGLGIEPQVMQMLFKEQFSTTTTGTLGEKGTGLGLPYSADIMRLLGGEISVESEINQGSQFILSLPSHRLRPSI
ncbi:MAG: sensor histidine kinase [bacterium]|nr:sensor histidine kinase [bacterium]